MAAGKLPACCLAGTCTPSSLLKRQLSRPQYDALCSSPKNRGRPSTVLRHAGVVAHGGSQADTPAMQRQILDVLTERALADARGYPSLGTQDLMPSPSDLSTSAEAADVSTAPASLPQHSSRRPSFFCARLSPGNLGCVATCVLCVPRPRLRLLLRSSWCLIAAWPARAASGTD